jgi:hypothetical protein
MSHYEAYCGLYCGACLCNIAFETGNIEELAKKTNRTIEQLTCTDCKTAKMQECSFVTCCIEKGIDNCSECADMPCEEMIKFSSQEKYPHLKSMIPNLERIRAIGLPAWLEEKKKEFTCPECGARLGWAYKSCMQCGCEIRR